MDMLFVFIIVATVSMLALAKMIVWLVNKSASSSITRYFQAAEYILEHHQAPPEWLQDKTKLFERVLKFIIPGKSVNEVNTPVMRHMNDLILFFEHSSFFEDDLARETLLNQLYTERENWVKNGI